MSGRRRMTEDEIEALKSPKGGFTRKALESVGVPWPPPTGWKQALLKGHPFDLPAAASAPSEEEFVHSTTGVLLSPIRPHVAAHDLLRQVVVAVIEAGHASDLYRFPDVIRYFGGNPEARPTRHDSGWTSSEAAALETDGGWIEP